MLSHRATCLFGRILFCVVVMTCFATVTEAQTITSYQLVNEQRDGRFEIQTYRVTLSNLGGALASAEARVESLVPEIVVLDPTVAFGPVPAGGTAVSRDTFAVRVNRGTTNTGPESFVWTVQTPGCAACVFGPSVYRRFLAVRSLDTEVFSADPQADYVIDIEDGSTRDGSYETVILNGRVILDPRTRGHVGPRHVRRAVRLQRRNTLLVLQLGYPTAPGITVRVLGGTKAIGATGGTIRVPGGKASLQIPAGALLDDTEISVVETPGVPPPAGIEGITALGATYSLEPHGLELPVAAKFVVDYSQFLASGQVASADQLGLVHFDDAGSFVEALGAEDNAPTRTLTAEIDNFSKITIIRVVATYSLYSVRWGIPVVTVSNGREFDTWQAETAGIQFSQAPSPNIVVRHVPKARRSNCKSGWMSIADQTGVTCVPRLTGILGINDQVEIYISDAEFPSNATSNEKDTALRHQIGHAIGIGHPWLNPTAFVFNPSQFPQVWPVMSDWRFYCNGCIETAHKLDRVGLHQVDIDAIRAKYGQPAPPPPTLLRPLPNAQIPQNDPSTGCALIPNQPRRGFGFKIDFDWTNVSQATHYRLTAKYPSAANPFVNVVVSQSDYSAVFCNSIAGILTGAVWQVQSINNGVAGLFSSPRALEFLPCVLSDGTGCSSQPGPVGPAMTRRLSFPDPVGDNTGIVDLAGFEMSFNHLTGAYAIWLTATPSQPFVGDFRVNINLAHEGSTSLFSDNVRDFHLTTPVTVLTLTGTSAALTTWLAGDRVAFNGGPGFLGGFRSQVVNLPIPLAAGVAEDSLSTIAGAPVPGILSFSPNDFAVVTVIGP